MPSSALELACTSFSSLSDFQLSGSFIQFTAVLHQLREVGSEELLCHWNICGAQVPKFLIDDWFEQFSLSQVQFFGWRRHENDAMKHLL